MKFTIGILGILFSFSVLASPVDKRSAWRDPHTNWQVYYQNIISDLKHTPYDKNAQEAAVKINKLDTSVVSEWGKTIDFMAVFFRLRDERFMETEDNPGFFRRISWQYPDDGCFARAGMMIERLRQWNVPDTSKVFIFGDLTVKTDNSSTGEVSWWYHVAPAVRVNDQVYILDAAIEPHKPLALVDWVKTMTPDPMQVKLAFCKANAYGPDDSCSNPTDKDPEDAPADQLRYLDREWRRAKELARDPLEVLGDNPPWKI